MSEVEIETLVTRVKCADGWFNVNQTATCFSLLWTKREISFNEAHKICLAQNASVFSTLETDEYFRTWESYQFKAKLLDGLAYKMYLSNISVADAATNKQGHVLQNETFGKPLHSKSLKNALPHMVHWMIPGPPNYLSFFTLYKNKCSIVEFSIISFNYIVEDAESHTTRGWGVKQRPCSELVDVAAVICEKPSDLYVAHCLQNHFECNDNTCILLIYRCDSVADCFDGEDEENCFLNNTTAMTSTPEQFVTLHCLHGEACNDTFLNVIHTHSLCDGVHLRNMFLKEKEVCPTFVLRHINISQLAEHWVNNQGMVYFKSTDIANLFLKEKYYKSHLSNTALFNHNFRMSSITPISQYQDLNMTTCADIDSLCKISIHKKTCSPKEFLVACKHITCPGMFKCNDYYCIYMSSVCDGQYDCKNGDDEKLCSILTCPGSLKCRGQNRCVSMKEICNNHVDCQYSMDDEMECQNCPSDCECAGYVVSCKLQNIQNVLTLNTVPYVKGLLLQFSDSTLYLQKFNLVSLVYLNISFSLIQHINMLKIAEEKTYPTSFLLIVDFSHNELKSAHFLKHIMFRKVIYLDLSFNLLYTLKYDVHLLSKYLSALLLSRNNLEYFEMVSQVKLDSLSLIDIQHVRRFSKLRIYISQKVYEELEMRVSESLLCCMLDNNIKCVLNRPEVIACFGLFAGTFLKNYFYCISLISIALPLVSIFKELVHISYKDYFKKRKYFLICLMSSLVSAFMASVYLVGLSLSDIMDVNAFVFRTGNMCLILNSILYTSLECTIIFKAFLVVIVALKVLYPFKHQCLWVKWTGPISIFVWLFILTTYMLNIVYINRNDELVFDKLCSIGWCAMRLNANYMYATLCLIDFTLICITVLSMFKTYTCLKKKSKLTALQSTKTYSAHIIIFKMLYPNFPELILRINLLFILIMKLSNWVNENYCSSLIVFVLPINIICTSVFSLLK